ncbi:DUF1622 domain-containing protein [Psychroserpens burtonensis]|uniref:DUF1622 domain-containing protein n=1 Tax=Psychroserpens burtonensis TaxID=49278 RepID=A0A5C7B531_9FLAO|nr:DUF1622 domain-containing protein [Psychroserpens burtonensis]TXE15944.1 DUF1622 domain-containing protein [Psychroserpens burtonensis]
MHHYIEITAKIIETIGILIILIGLLYALGASIRDVLKKAKSGYGRLRKSILLGLDILIAVDIVTTVVILPTLESVSILGVIVLIRTFLSLSIQVEIEGKFPWQNTSNDKLHDYK